MTTAVWELWRGNGRYIFSRRGRPLRSVRGMVIDAAVLIEDTNDAAEAAMLALKDTESAGPGELPDVGTLQEVLVARWKRASRRRSCR